MSVSQLQSTLLPHSPELNFERHGFRFQRLTEVRWRISNTTGAVVGYLEERPTALASDRWAIMRMTADRRGFLTLGAFASMAEATAALKWM
ncbi:hypothetical protein [Gulosibacter chungangensis]|uniref:Uncharacterized protein n=1 Tax=Gulosibacter chungangensis TaxID=979746 RepID=A0A7J5BCP8_9MICO|nr:hypothetical protein [Gulosibacter chungangensis]KAB1642721.1 hypothetical protein F8O05_09700 [Gulosibacter chungangensis]